MNSLLHRKPRTARPSTTAKTSLPESLSLFFKGKISKPPLSSPHADSPCALPDLYRFTLIIQDEIIKLILKSLDKLCDLDPIPTSLPKISVL